MPQIFPKKDERYAVQNEIWGVAEMQRDPVGFPQGWEIKITGVFEALGEITFKATHPNQPTWGDGRNFLDRGRFQGWLESGKIKLI